MMQFSFQYISSVKGVPGRDTCRTNLIEDRFEGFLGVPTRPHVHTHGILRLKSERHLIGEAVAAILGTL